MASAKGGWSWRRELKVIGRVVSQCGHYINVMKKPTVSFGYQGKVPPKARDAWVKKTSAVRKGLSLGQRGGLNLSKALLKQDSA